MYEVRVFLIVRPVKGGGDEFVAVRLTLAAAEALLKGRPDLRIRRAYANKLDAFTDFERMRLISAEGKAA